MLSSGLSGHRSVDSITDFTGRSLKFSGFSDKKNWDWLFAKTMIIITTKIIAIITMITITMKITQIMIMIIIIMIIKIIKIIKNNNINKNNNKK